MKISYSWLKEYIDFDYPVEELCDILTMLGLEVGGLERLGRAPETLSGVVVGEVLSAEKHPNADRLKVCVVDVGESDPLHIVCGAPNVAAGQKVPVATVGTTLHPFEGDPFKIKKGKIRGEVSMGMICAEDELGLGADHAGILVLDDKLAIGTPFAETLADDQDYQIEIDLTPNRIDGVSHYGVARDLGAFMRKKAQMPPISIDPQTLKKKNPIDIQIVDEDKCHAFAGIYVEGVQIGESPDWLKKRIESVGLRPINNVVDITNFVMIELGQPLHAYDADTLKGQQIVVKTMDKDTTFTTLDKVERKIIAHEDLMICDAKGMLGIGGIMGGLSSGVTEKTTNILLEAAYFDPGTVRKTSKRLGLHTDAAFRFERGVDPFMNATAVLRAAHLVLELAGGSPSQLTDLRTRDFPHFKVDLSLKRANTLYGNKIPRKTQIEILEALDIQVEEDSKNKDLLHLQVPPYRVDVQRPQDVMEEILRVYGYNQIKVPEKVNLSLTYQDGVNAFQLRDRYSDYLAANGFYETLTNSLVSRELGNEQAVSMLNPLSEDLAILRQSMLPTTLESIRFNQNRQNENLKLFEFGRTYDLHKELFKEQEWLVLAITGKQHAPYWEQEAQAVNLYTLTREVDRIRSLFNIEGELRPYEHPELDYGLELVSHQKQVLYYGRVSVEWLEKYDLKNEVFYLCANWPLLIEHYGRTEITYQDIPLYPSIRRDLSLLLSDTQSFQELSVCIQKANPKLIRSIELHDIYQGEGVPTGKKSYLVSIVLRDDKKTLEDKAADKVISRVLGLLDKELGVGLRG